MLIWTTFPLLMCIFSFHIKPWWGKTIPIEMTSSFVKPNLYYGDIILDKTMFPFIKD